jgi:(p)ppGpp synthase/HD superfamily hydrolase
MSTDSETSFGLRLRAATEAELSRLLPDVSSLARSIAPDAEVYGRVKSNASAANKRRTGRLRGTQVLDAIGIRVIVSTEEQCYCLMELIHSLFPVATCEFDDYIKAPKPNGYRSLHTTLVTANDHAVEIQIRTAEMHACAERGTAAHCLYKQATTVRAAAGYDE